MKLTIRLAVAALSVVATLTAPGGSRAAAASGPRLAFSAGSSLYVVGADGTGQREIGRAPTSNALPMQNVWFQDPSWSPDGARVAYATTQSVGFQAVQSELRIAWAADAGDQPLVAVPVAGWIQDVAWSPDGRRLAFVVFTYNAAVGIATWTSLGSRWEMYVVNADGSGLQPVAPVHASHSVSPAWSPDGHRLAFVSDLDGVSAVYAVAMTGVPLITRLSPIGVSAWNPRWSPAGDRVAFTGTPVVPPTALLEIPQLWIVQADGSNPRALPVTTWDAPSWSPDGRWLAITCSQGCGIAAVRDDGAAIRALAPEPAFGPQWSRHGEIAYVRASRTCCERTAWVMNGDGSNPHQVSNAIALTPLAWSA